MVHHDPTMYAFSVTSIPSVQVTRPQRPEQSYVVYDSYPHDAAMRLIKHRIKIISKMPTSMKYFLVAAVSFLAIMITVSGIVMTVMAYRYSRQDSEGSATSHDGNQHSLSSPAEARIMRVAGPVVLTFGFTLVICIYVCFTIIQSRIEGRVMDPPRRRNDSNGVT